MNNLKAVNIVVNGANIPYWLSDKDIENLKRHLSGFSSEKIFISEDENTHLAARSIDGFTVIPKPAKPVTEKMMELLEKQVSQSNEGDNWKN